MSNQLPIFFPRCSHCSNPGDISPQRIKENSNCKSHDSTVSYQSTQEQRQKHDETSHYKPWHLTKFQITKAFLSPHCPSLPALRLHETIKTTSSSLSSHMPQFLRKTVLTPFLLLGKTAFLTWVSLYLLLFKGESVPLLICSILSPCPPSVIHTPDTRSYCSFISPIVPHKSQDSFLSHCKRNQNLILRQCKNRLVKDQSCTPMLYLLAETSASTVSACLT